MQIIVKKKKNDSTAQWMGKQTLITCPAPQGNQTVFFLLILQFEQERQRNNTKY